MLPAVFGRVRDYRDEDLTFHVQVRGDGDRLNWMLGHLRRHYPGARVVIRSDGDDDPRLPGIAAAHGAEFEPDEHLYDMVRGGWVCHRMLELFFRKPSRFFFKIDTDTGIHRRFAYLPTHAGLFGTLQVNDALLSIQGGCIGIARDAMEAMWRSEAFLDPALADPGSTWAASSMLLKYVRQTGKVCDDWLFGYAATALGLPMFGFAEVCSDWKTYRPNPQLRYAVTHPCKDLRL